MSARVAKFSKSHLELPDFVPAGFRTPCRDVDPELFFPIGDRYSDLGRQVCWGCELQQPCADWAIESGEPFGLWGGLDPEQRAARRRMRERTWS